MMNNANQLNMDMKNNNLNKQRFFFFKFVHYIILPDACAGIEKLAVDVG